MVSFTVLFGLYHGLLFLPVVLAFMGADNEEEEIQEDVNGKGTSNQTWNDKKGEVNYSFNDNDNPSDDMDKHQRQKTTTC